MKVLIVDDFGSMRSLLRRIIENAGLGDEVIEASCADSAVERVGTHRPDVVLLDISMPGRDGTEAIKEILELHPTATVIMVSASSCPDQFRKAIRSGARDFIVKPFKEHRLIDSIKQHSQEYGL